MASDGWRLFFEVSLRRLLHRRWTPKLALFRALRWGRVSSTQPLPAVTGGVRRGAATETGLPGWAYRIRTGESVRGVSDWNCVTTSPGE